MTLDEHTFLPKRDDAKLVELKEILYARLRELKTDADVAAMLSYTDYYDGVGRALAAEREFLTSLLDVIERS